MQRVSDLLRPWPEVAARDPTLHRMLVAAEGSADAWREVCCAMRDAMVAWAADRSPFYRERIDPGTPFERIRPLIKADVRMFGDDIKVPDSPPAYLIEKETSGSTGEPMVFYRDLPSGYTDLSAREFLRHLHGVPNAATMVSVAAPRNGGVGAHPDPGVHIVYTTDFAPARVAHEVAHWQKFPEYYFYGYASGLEWLVDQIERQGLDIGRAPTCVITTGDLLTESGKERLGRVLRCPVHSWYGSNEMGGYLAGTVPGTDQYLFNPLLAYVEVLDDSDRVVPPGTVGRLVVTHLGNYSFPLIRYDTGDRAALAVDQTGGGFFVMEQLEGRSSEQLTFPSGKTLSPVMLGNRLVVAPRHGPLIRLFQCAQVGDNELELRIVWQQPPPASLRVEIADMIRTQTDPDTVIRIRDVDALDTLPSGKRWIVKDERSR